MTAIYWIEFYEPWTGAAVTGSFRRWVVNATDAENIRARNEKALCEKYGGGVVKLIELY